MNKEDNVRKLHVELDQQDEDHTEPQINDHKATKYLYNILTDLDQLLDDKK